MDKLLLTPYFRRHKRPHTHVLVPFASGCTFYRDDAAKMLGKGEKGIVLGYAQLGAYCVLSVKGYDTRRQSVYGC